MVVDDLDVVCIAVVPAEADAPLVVDPDTVLAFSIASKRFEAVPRRCSQVVELPRAVQEEQLAAGDPFERTKSTYIAIIEQSLRVLRSKRPDHSKILVRVT